MADAPTPADPKGKGKGKKIMGLPPWALGLGIAVTAGGILFFLYERHKQAAAAGTSGGGSTGVCYDASGNQVACSDSSAVTDQSGEISTLQTEIADIQGQLAGQGGGGGDKDSDGDQPGGPDSGGGGGSIPWGQNAVNLNADAKQALIKGGDKNPTKAQIAEERKDIIQTARDPGRRHPNARRPRPRRIDRPRRRRRAARR